MRMNTDKHGLFCDFDMTAHNRVSLVRGSALVFIRGSVFRCFRYLGVVFH